VQEEREGGRIEGAKLRRICGRAGRLGVREPPREPEAAQGRFSSAARAGHPLAQTAQARLLWAVHWVVQAWSSGVSFTTISWRNARLPASRSSQASETSTSCSSPPIQSLVYWLPRVTSGSLCHSTTRLSHHRPSRPSEQRLRRMATPRSNVAGA
jgi:hypothetical protein